jgi:glycine oxidase
VTRSPSADTVVIGGGLIGLSCAAALARDGTSSILLDDGRLGVASTAAAGMLAPSVERPDGRAFDFAVAARDRYPEYIDWLRDETGRAVPLNSNGILQVAVTPAGVRGLRRAMPRTATWLDGPSLQALEPALSHALGAAHHPRDGAVDNVLLLEALGQYCATSPRVTRIDATATGIDLGADSATVRTADGTAYGTYRVILAAGAWVARLSGLAHDIPVAPARGQMLAYPSLGLRHVVFGPRGYIVPRGGVRQRPALPETLVGATTEHVGFDTATTPAGMEKLRRTATEILPSLRDVVPLRHWSGLRPMTPDLLPIVGPDPAEPALVYACGHSRNGILMAPLTADCISAVVRGVQPPADLAPLSIARFPARSRSTERPASNDHPR